MIKEHVETEDFGLLAEQSHCSYWVASNKELIQLCRQKQAVAHLALEVLSVKYRGRKYPLVSMTTALGNTVLAFVVKDKAGELKLLTDMRADGSGSVNREELLQKARRAQKRFANKRF